MVSLCPAALLRALHVAMASGSCRVFGGGGRPGAQCPHSSPSWVALRTLRGSQAFADHERAAGWQLGGGVAGRRVGRVPEFF